MSCTDTHVYSLTWNTDKGEAFLLWRRIGDPSKYDRP